MGGGGGSDKTISVFSSFGNLFVYTYMQNKSAQYTPETL